jgi:hypothetical protein
MPCADREDGVQQSVEGVAAHPDRDEHVHG